MKKVKEHSGVIVPMITPFTNNGEIDFGAVEKIINNFIQNGVYPFILGTTGESTSISNKNKLAFANFVCNKFSDKTKVYVGIASNVITTSIENANVFLKMGASAVVSHLPTYYPLKPYHMLNYFSELADSINGPLIIYNITATTHMSIPLEVIEKLSYKKNIVGLKDSERDEERMHKAIEMWKDRNDFSHFIGWGTKCAEGLRKGSDGIVPSTGNYSPKIYADLYTAILNGDNTKADLFQEQADEISLVYQKDRILSESLPALKVMMENIGLCKSNVLPPFLKLKSDEEKIILKKLHDINNNN